jgi:FlaA1/EpsC-like NDP-sugar epimerase
VFGTLNVVDLSEEFGVKKAIMVSTDKAVNPTNVMGATKRMCEMIITAMDKVSETRYVAVRFGNVLGSNGSVVPLFKKQIAAMGPVTVTHPDIIRYFMTIPEAARLVVQAGAMAKGGEIFILDMGDPVKIDDLARDMIRLSGYTPDVDIKIEYTGLRPGEKLYEELMQAEEGTTKSSHDGIFIAKPETYTMEQVEEKLSVLRDAVGKDDETVVKCLAEVVPTFQPEKAGAHGK